MHNRFDQLGKKIGLEALGPSGVTVAHDEISPDAHHADLRHEPDPGRAAERARLGLLAARRARDWPRGVYVSPGVLPAADGARLDEIGGKGGLLRLGVVVASELPRDRSTLLVRLMAAGPLLKGALEDLSALPADAHERAVASRILLGLQRALGSKPNRTTEEKELIVDLQRMGEKMLEKASREGRLVQARAALRRVLAVRKLATGPADDARIDDCTDLATLERWHDQALTAPSAARALQVPAPRARRGGAGPHPAR